jgi:hypothetical protein
MFRMADEVLAEGVIRDDTAALLTSTYSQAQIVEGLFFLLLIGASHRFSRALRIEEACALPTRMTPDFTAPIAPVRSPA